MTFLFQVGVEAKLWWVVVVVVLPALFIMGAEGHGQVPCYFIFGDSLADNGNNNLLETLAKVNYPPYGIDFPFGPTGRFSNGRTTVDVIAEVLGFDNFIPPFASVNGTDILFGVNYASGSAGILNETGQQLGERIPLDMQLENHRTIVLRLVEILGTELAASWYLSKCLYTVGLGNNDYINNYFLPQYYNTSRDYTLLQYTELLIEQYTQQIKTLHKYGARKIALFGLGQIGCTPDAISTYGTNGSTCVEIMEEASLLFNSKLKLVVEQLNANITDAKFIYINYYTIGADSSVLGFTNASAGCCPVASDGQCIPDQVPCQNRTAYAFWDSFHPTEAVNVYIGLRSYSSLHPSDAYPFDIRNLVMLNQETGAAVSGKISIYQE
ncbi:GDSL esterase/lipase At1g29670 [Ricinus communis]|uniref:Zinc finger protein, putative n=1 Tax=Ricinus communis TaxID=3988 RepID=B9S8H0_RICCO|nr:GDSL esterase/lipase At1g29670 [Ricinus communis]EEF40147.1 zinc finger protein, putative [Ricinus communis]|eukprot:XP_002522289.1 GDSL esterase/lipase At1g29670 [Ricinus communis]